MFGGDVHARTYAGLERAGIGGQLARIGLDEWTRELADVRFELSAIATRTHESALRAQQVYEKLTGSRPKVYSGDEPWNALLRDLPEVDVVAIATPDSLHTQVICSALKAGAHVITEKPMCLDMAEADGILDLSATHDRIVAVDMHKRYDPDHLRIRDDLAQRIGEPLYGMAYLEEPIEVSASTFKWVEESDPFSYVGTHWVDLIYHYFRSPPVSLTAVGQKRRLVQKGINAFDAVQVRVDFANGLSVHFMNNWITPSDFEGPVNQGHELVGTEGKIECDQQYRGLRWWNTGGGSRTANNHFTREVKRPAGPAGFVGYGVDSLVAGMAAICRKKFLGASGPELKSTYPNAEEARIVTAIVHAARVVRDLNFGHLERGKAAAATAWFGEHGIAILDPLAASPDPIRRSIYNRPL
jgi:predicted dehydrogenase